MSEFENSGLRVIIVRPGQTELDQQGRISGSLDVPLSDDGRQQVEALATEFESWQIDKIYAGPITASRETAELLAIRNKIKIRIEDDLKNFDCGLWHGKRIEELKETQPKLFKLWQEQPESVFPPDGETVEATRARLEKFAKRLTKKQRNETVIVIAAEPVACILRSVLESVEVNKYWTVETNCGSWFEVTRQVHPVSS